MTPAAATSAKPVSAALYGAFEELVEAAARGARVERAVFPLRHPASPFLTEEQRDALWRMFEAPAYALLVDGQGDVVGYECEAQEGMHVRDAYAAGMPDGRIESRLCECGRPGPRLMPADAIRTAACSPESESLNDTIAG